MNDSSYSSATARLRVSDDVLFEASAFADSSAEQFAFSGKDKSVLCLIIEELVTNCINHGNMKPGDTIRLDLNVSPSDLIIEFSDIGIPFNPLTDIVEQDMEAAVENRTLGGLGWPFISHFCEIIDCSRRNSRNHLTLRYLRSK